MNRHVGFGVRATIPVLSLAFFLFPVLVTAQKAEPDVSVQEIIVSLSGKADVQPKSLPPGSLCTLRVRLRNAGTQKASSFGFTVKLNENQVATYEKMLYFHAIDPSTTGEIALSNFYTPDAQVKDAKVTVEVTLREARWMDIRRDGETQTWVPTGDVKGLPSSKSISVPVAAAAG
jgi:hypothetical protein